MVGVYNLWDTATTINATASITSSAISTLYAKGYFSILVLIDAGSAKSLDVTYTVGKIPEATFYTPVDTNGTGLGTINTTSITTSTWISFAVGAPAPYIKIVITGSATNGADTTARAYLFSQEEMLPG